VISVNRLSRVSSNVLPSSEVDVVRAASAWAESPSTAPSLLLTVLGEWVLPHGRHAWTSTLVGALDSLGVPEAAARQALARSARRGLLVAERVGRRTRWVLSARAVSLLEEGTSRIYRFATSEPEWDGTWLLVLVSVSEPDRHLRARLRTRLAWSGLGQLAPGSWVTPWAVREPEVIDTLGQLGLADAAVSWVGRPGRLGSLDAQVGRIWDLADLELAYREFVATTLGPGPEGPFEAFAALTRLVHAWRRFPSLDPGLPAPLLPASWPAADAARAFHAARAAWRPAALSWWSTLTELR
jgi:phenylacetic acid degradation operon negative regulatory protein